MAARALLQDDGVHARELPCEIARRSDPGRTLARERRQHALDRRKRGLSCRRRKPAEPLGGEVGGERSERRLAGGREVGRHAAQVVDELERGDRRELHVEAVELHLAVMRAVPGPHPLDQGEHLLSIPGPKAHAGERIGGIAAAVQHIVVDGERLREACLDPEHRESELADAELEQPVLELEEFAGAVGRFAQRYDARVADDAAQRLQIGKARARRHARQRDGVRPDPVDRLVHHRTPPGGQSDEGADGSISKSALLG
jgi:hypothetical protein